jgi:pimeloyl-ACP methyl ester carboxylesterase
MAGMTLVFVHGNPETSAIWGPLVADLGRDDVVLLSPPGFGAPLPDGFGATFLEYRDWLEGELEKIDGPIDLVGHDWGGGHVVNVVMHRPELVRSWASDVVGLFDPDYVWHDMAQAWQTPGVGEESLAAMMGGGLAARTELMVSFGIPADIGAAIAEHQNDDMAKAILALYRSAAQPALAEAGRALENAQARPGLALLATDDPFIGVSDNRRRAADRAGARTAVLEGLGHWWMVEDPKRGAAALAEFWASLD